MKPTFLNYLILISIVFTSCVSTKKFLKHEQIPDDFGKGDKAILIIPSLTKKIDKTVVAAFAKYYKGRYEIGGGSTVVGKPLLNLGYTFHTYIEHTAGRFTATGREAPGMDVYFGVRDLQTKKTYKMVYFGNYKKFAKFYVQALEIVRKRNE